MNTARATAALAGAFCMALLASCAGPPLSLYTLGEPAAPDPPALEPSAKVIEITRASLPDELDNEDILLREGSLLQRSSHGRWASRLSLQVTDLITQRLAARYPEALVTGRRQIDSPWARLSISITRLEVTSAGAARVEADWVTTPQDPDMPLLRYRRAFDATGPVATDRDIVALEAAVLSKLADAIASDRVLLTGQMR